MDPIQTAMDAGDFALARELAVARVRSSPDDDEAVRLLLEVERRAIEEKRRAAEDDGDDTLSGMFPRRWRRKLDNRLTAVIAVVFLAVSGWWLWMGLSVGATGSFPMRTKSGSTREVRRPEALSMAGLTFIFGAGAAGVALWSLRRE